MQRPKSLSFRLLTTAGLLVWLVLCGVNRLPAQDSPKSYRPPSPPPLKELPGPDMRVSLSAATLTDILLHEPGLLLQVKRFLVLKAYEQGRLLDPEDLTDEALFRLLREDESVRILATEQVESRGYVKPKPNSEELEEKGIERIIPQTTGNPSGVAQAPQGQEEKYWAEHEQLNVRERATLRPDLSTHEPELEPQDEMPAPGKQIPATQPPARPPQPDYRRQQDLAGTQPPGRDTYDMLPPDAGSLPRISPDGLPGLLSASMTENRGSAARLGSDGVPLSPGGLSQTWRPDLRADTGAPPAPTLSASAADRSPEKNWQREFDNRMQPPAASLPDESHPQVRHRANPYADVPSLYDLYAQVARRTPVLDRFGADVFTNGTGNFDELPMDMPVGPDYVLGPGDGLSIEMWGGVSQRLQRVVDREGRVALPEAGAVPVTGRTLGEVQQLFQTVLRNEFRDVQADVSLSRLRTVRVYVVGDVERPGAYDVSSLSTPLNALYQAGGPTSRGSLRILRHYRGQQLIEEVDVYSMLLHGVRSGVARLQAGDTILVPPISAEVTIQGMVRRPAIYELDHESNLAEVLELAGGVMNSGTLRHIEVERVVAHESRTMMRLDIPENNNQEAITATLENFKVQDGDKIRIAPILAYSEKTVYLDGHVFHPGKFAFRDGMRVTDLIKSGDDLLPEPARHAEIIRLNPPDYAPTVIALNLTDALSGKEKEEDVALKPFDTVRVFSRYDFEDAPVVTVSGEVRDPGAHFTNGATHLRDAVYLAGGITPDAQTDDAQVFRQTSDGKLKVLSVNLGKALTGDATENVALEPKDRVFIHRNLSKVDPPSVKIEGEVAKPGKYPLGEEMTTTQLVRLAGGLKRGAFTEAADLTRYAVENGAQVMGEHLTVPVGRALAGEADTDVLLHDGDVLTIRQLAGWSDVGSLVTIKGEVMHPGEYGIQEGERLSTVLARAGGLRADAYPYGAILERRQVREFEEKNRGDLIRQVQDQQTSFKLMPETGDAEDKLAKEATIQQWRATLEQLKNTPPAGRLVINISRNIKKWANTSADIEIRAGDTLFIPKTPNSVLVNGQVYNPTAITYRPGKSAGWYLNQAGGPTTMANKKAIIVIRADGSVAGHNGGWFTGDGLTAELRPGDMVFVPEKALGGGVSWRNLSLSAQLASSLAIAASVAHSF